MTMMHRCCVFLVGALCAGRVLADEPFSPAPDTQNPDDRPPTPAESLAKITVPEGFRVTLFAAEPDVRQPIDMKFDERGRLWVAECYSYDGTHFVEGVDDRILILEDTDRDGRFDKRKVFWDKANRLTSLEFAPGGLFVLNAGELQFVPDANGDDKPDGKPLTLLDGFDTYDVGHNIVSGLIWGPDGWIYGRHGIKATSRPGPPDVPPQDRIEINCGIWRYHPRTRAVEAVVHGTTNPWGLDFNSDGELFFTNNVIGHLWYVIPGAHYKRMYGEDFNPHLYELIDQTADHYHWDNSQKWTDSRDAAGVHGELGGGHSHCGGMIYLGDNFPEEYRGRMFMCNTHGRRLNEDKLVRVGSGYVGRHEPDFFFANNPWFRGVSLLYGPDGAVYVSDWCDFGECHDHDGIHRSSGRIYRVSYGEPTPEPRKFDLSHLSPHDLAVLHGRENEWYVRTARRLLIERQWRGDDIEPAVRGLMRTMVESHDPQESLKAVFTLAALGRVDDPMLEFLLSQRHPADDHLAEHHRAWGLKLLAEYRADARRYDNLLLDMAETDPSALVRLRLVSICPALPESLQWSILQTIAKRTDEANDPNLPLMVWYRMESLMSENPDRALILLDEKIDSMLYRFIARRVTSDLETKPKYVNLLAATLSRQTDSEVQRQILSGMTEALRGWRKATPPSAWAIAADSLRNSDSEQIRELTQELSLVFGDGRAMDDLRKVAADSSESPEARRRAIRLLNQSQAKNLLPLLLKLLPDRITTPAVLECLADHDDPRVAEQIINRYRSFPPEWKRIAVDTLTSRVSFARKLLEAVARGRIDRGDITADQARQIGNLGDAGLAELLGKVWGTLRQTPAEKQAMIADWKEELTPDELKHADASHGRALFAKTCAKCHTLYGEGEKIAPDLTGSNRDNLDYLLGNIIDPSGAVPQTFKVSVVALQDGRVLTGVLGRDDGTTVDIQTAKEKVTVLKSDIAAVKPSDLSLMPDGLLKDLSKADVRDLIGYLQSRRQVPLPPGDAK